MKKILISLSIVGAVAAIAIGATSAYFSDTETSTGNTFTAGTIDIAVTNPTTWQYDLNDMKPSQVEYTNFTISNATGNNPVNVWKKVTPTQMSEDAKENGVNEPECSAYHGIWNGSICNDPVTVKNDIDTAIQYDLSVVLKDANNTPQWNQTLYNLNKTIADIANQGDYGTFLGMIPAGWSMDVVESYHMDKDTENWAQSDKMTFDITLTGEQLKGTAVLEDKDPSNWRVKSETAPTGTLTYGVKDSKFNYSFSAVGMTSDKSYSLIAYHEPFSDPVGPGGPFPRPVTIIGSATADVLGVVTIPQTSVELGMNLLNMKVWLVETSALSGDTIVGWNPAEILFDTGLIDYYDTDL